MSSFKYKARDKEGKVYERVAEAETRLALYDLIRQEGGSVLSVREVKRLSLGSISFSFGGVKTQQKITFAKNLSTMMDAGLSVTRSLAVMAKQAKSKAYKKILNDIETDVSKGETLSQSLGKLPKVFSPLFVSMVKAGEESGNLVGALSIVASQMEKSYLLVKKVRGALIYPAVIFTLMITIGILMLVFMVPTLTATFEGLGAELPLSTRMIIAASDFLVANTILVVMVLLLLVLAVVAFMKSSSGRRIADVLFLKIPVIGPLLKEVQSARTARTLSSLLEAGVDIVVAFDVTIDVMQNHLYKDALSRARKAIEKGEPVSAVFVEYEHLYPIFVGEMVAVGEETGQIAKMLMGVGTFYENEVDQKTKDLSTIIEPILMIFIGIAVGIFAISMLAPTYSLVETF